MSKALFFIFFNCLILLAFCQKNTWTDGEWLYQKNCGSCHGAKGEGLGQLIPPLAASDFLTPNRDYLACIVHQGLKDTILVNGKTYAEAMAGVPKLSVVEITNVLNFIGNSWGNQNGIYKPEEIRSALKQCK